MAIKTLNFFVEMQNVNLGYGRTTYRVFTSDEHSIELNFEILDIENLSGMTAEIMIYTEDKSLFVNKATFKAPNSYSYIMQPQEDARRGLCIVQLLLKDGAKILTSPKFKFEIERSVNDEVVQESGIVNTWEDFKKDTETWSKETQEKLDAWSEEMTEKVNEMKSKAEKEEARRVEAEELRVRRENVRAGNEASREQAEKSRNTAETNRAEAEKLRVEAESKRNSRYEQAEAARNSKYDSAEKTRESKFIQAEQARADAEAKRVTAEQSRASEESKRATAESTRESAEANRANEETKRVNAEKEREFKFNGWDKTMQGVIPEATADKAGIVKVEGTSGESAPYTVYSKGKLADKLTVFMNDCFEDYQPKLTAGDNITIEENTISYDDTKLREEISKKYVTTEKLDIGGAIPDVARLYAKGIALNSKNRGLAGVLTTDDIKIVQGNMGNSAIINADVVLTTDRKTQNQYRLLSEKDTGSGSGLNADKLDGYHADQFFTKYELKIFQGSGTFSFKIFNNIESIQWVLLNNILFYDIVFASNDDGLMQRVNAGIPLAKLDLPRPLKKKVYLDATNPRDGWVPKMFYIRENGDIHFNRDNPTKTKYIDVTNPYFVKGIAINI